MINLTGYLAGLNEKYKHNPNAGCLDLKKEIYCYDLFLKAILSNCIEDNPNSIINVGGIMGYVPRNEDWDGRVLKLIG